MLFNKIGRGLEHEKKNILLDTIYILVFKKLLITTFVDGTILEKIIKTYNLRKKRKKIYYFYPSITLTK